MGWTTIDLGRNRMTPDQAKQHHLEGMMKAYEVLAHEWHDDVLFSILKPKWNHPEISSAPFVRIDIIEAGHSFFAYKDMCEDMGPYHRQSPSDTFAELIYAHVPKAEGFALDWRRRNNVRFDYTETNDDVMANTPRHIKV